MALRFYTKNVKSFHANKEAMTLIFPIQNKIKIWKNRRHGFVFAQNDLGFFCVEF